MINKLKFSIDVMTEKNIIWKALWDDRFYSEWVGVFYEGSYAVTDDWQEGSKVYFLAPDESGIYSIIEKHVPDKIIQFKHIGKVIAGKEQPIDEETQKWSGATETYKLIERDMATTLEVEIDVMSEHLEFMKNTFPQALKKIKENCG